MPSHVCRLRKAIYGLKQAPRAWYNELNQSLLHMGFRKSQSDTSLFFLQNHSVTIYLLVYVDDIIITRSSQKIINQVISSLSRRFSIKDLGTLHYFLGIEVTRKAGELIMSQSQYIMDILRDSNMQESKGVATPMSSSQVLSLHDGTKLADAKEYRKVLVKLQYLAFTRPDISYSVNKLSQYMHSPTETHWKAVKRLLKYLNKLFNIVCASLGTLTTTYTCIRTLIGREITMIEPLPQAIFYISVPTRSVGFQRNKK